jgi:hypothetical protein
MFRSSGPVAGALAALLVLGGCSSGGGRSATATSAPAPIVVKDEREAVLSAAIGERVVADNLGVFYSIEAPPDKVYQALIVAYGDLGIPATIVNPKDGLVAVTNRWVIRTLGDSRLSRYLSCGESMTGPRADQDRVVISVISWAKPDGAGSTRIETRIVAMANDTGGSNVRMPCTTTGQLESELHRAAKRALGP